MVTRKFPRTLTGIESGTYLVEQCLNQLRLTEICSNIIVPFVSDKRDNWSLIKRRA